MLAASIETLRQAKELPEAKDRDKRRRLEHPPH